jgi:DNA mismatch repair ATPase MutL
VACCSLALAAAALIKPLGKACGILADELRQALLQQQKQPQSQQQQPPKAQQQQQQQRRQQLSQGMRSGFLSAGSRQQQPKQPSLQQQQQQQPAANLPQALSLARSLIMIWLNLVMDNLDAAGIAAVFSNAAVCASILPAVKLMLVMLQAQSSSNPAATSHINADGGNEPWGQVQTALAVSTNVAQAIAAGQSTLHCGPSLV